MFEQQDLAAPTIYRPAKAVEPAAGGRLSAIEAAYYSSLTTGFQRDGFDNHPTGDLQTGSREAAMTATSGEPPRP